MDSVPVIWWTANPESIARGYWDQALLEALIWRAVWRPPLPLQYGSIEVTDGGSVADLITTEGAILVVPGGHNAAPECVQKLRETLAPLEWWLLVLTGDEERSFPIHELPVSERSAVWATSGRPGEERIEQTLGFGWQPAVWDHLHRQHGQPALEWETAFVGQDTHGRRHELVDAMRTLPEAETLLVLTSEFGGTASPKGDGLTPEAYAEALSRTRVAPAPSGPVIPDSFRLFEALESGALPIADTVTGAHGPEPTYWHTVCGGEPPFPTTDSWEKLPQLLEQARADWPANVNRATAWWGTRKRELAIGLDATVRRLAGVRPPDSGDDEITVVITTSPTPKHPDTTDTWDVYRSVRERLGHDAEVIIAADGVRPEQEDRRADYEEYLRRLIWGACHEENVVVLRYDEWRHQALTTADALQHVVTPLVLFLEHDTPLQGPDIDWDACGYALHDGVADLIRFHHESRVLPVHEHLMIGEPDEVEGVFLRPTVQWSQRPHLARTLWYRQLLATYFGSESRTMIEDTMHGVVDYYWRTFGTPGWEQFRLWLYHEPDEHGSIQRSGHLDGRGADPKFPMRYAYDGEQPEGAPAPSRRRS